MSVIVKTSDLRFFYTPDEPIINNVSFEVEESEVKVILGLSGCGKSTLIRLIDGILKPTAGSIMVSGIDVGRLGKTGLIRYRRSIVSVVFQNYGLLPHLSVIDNVVLGLRIMGTPKYESYEKCKSYLDLVGLYKYRNADISSLSGGMKQRVGIARALSTEPRLLLMDEPFGALDPITRNELRGELLRIRDRLGITILIVTHDLSEALHLGDKMIVMRDGQIIQEGTPNEVVSTPNCEYVSKFVESSRLIMNEYYKRR